MNLAFTKNRLPNLQILEILPIKKKRTANVAVRFQKLEELLNYLNPYAERIFSIWAVTKLVAF